MESREQQGRRRTGRAHRVCLNRRQNRQRLMAVSSPQEQRQRRMQRRQQLPGLRRWIEHWLMMGPLSLLTLSFRLGSLNARRLSWLTVRIATGGLEIKPRKKNELERTESFSGSQRVSTRPSRLHKSCRCFCAHHNSALLFCFYYYSTAHRKMQSRLF